MVFKSFSGAKKNKQRNSKAIQERGGTNQTFPILFRTKVEQTKLSQNFQDQRRTNQSCPKRIKLEQKETLPKRVPNGNPKLGG
jgi:hypothetical protein